MSTDGRNHRRAVYTDFEDMDVTPGVEALKAAGFSVELLDSKEAEQIVAAGRDADALLIGYAEVTRGMIEQMPRLQVIATLSMGFDNIDVDAATEHGVWVTNILGAATEEVATHALALILHLSRQLSFYQQAATPQRWNDRDVRSPRRLSGQTLGLVGLGRIGAKLAELSMPLFGRIIGYDPFLLADSPAARQVRTGLSDSGVEILPLDQVVEESDVLSLHLPLSVETAGMVNADMIARMRSSALLINVSRGALVDSNALRAAVDEGRLGGAGLDVLEVEPPPAGHPLLAHPRIVVTPHVGYLSDFSDAEYVRLQAANVTTWALTGTPISPVNHPTLATSRR